MRLYWHLFPNFLVDFDSGKIEKEKKKVAQEAGFLRTEVTGGEVSDWNGKYFHGVKCGRFLLWLLEICWSYFCNGFNMVFFFLLKTRWQKKQKEKGGFSSYKCVRYHHGATIYILFLIIINIRGQIENRPLQNTCSAGRKRLTAGC